MEKEFVFWPEQASSFASQVDALYIYLIGFSFFFLFLITILVFYFAVKYRRKSDSEIPQKVETSKVLEVLWTVGPFLLIIPMFVFGAKIMFQQMRAPTDAMEILVTGKQWMWKFQHPNGRREINDLHIPVNLPVKMLMGSEDVIHSLFVPAFRIKQDVLPGRYTTMWFKAIKVGKYHLFCNQYCGTNHSMMIGTVYVMPQDEYEAWVSGYTGASPAQQGQDLFNKYACNTCHVLGSSARGPNLNGVFGSKVGLMDGSSVIADANYVRESILNPSAKVVAGFQPIMPTFQGTLTEEQVSYLVAYVRSLASNQNVGANATGQTDKATGTGQPLPENIEQTSGSQKTAEGLKAHTQASDMPPTTTTVPNAQEKSATNAPGSTENSTGTRQSLSGNIDQSSESQGMARPTSPQASDLPPTTATLPNAQQKEATQ